MVDPEGTHYGPNVGYGPGVAGRGLACTWYMTTGKCATRTRRQLVNIFCVGVGGKNLASRLTGAISRVNTPLTAACLARATQQALR